MRTNRNRFHFKNILPFLDVQSKSCSILTRFYLWYILWAHSQKIFYVKVNLGDCITNTGWEYILLLDTFYIKLLAKIKGDLCKWYVTERTFDNNAFKDFKAFCKKWEVFGYQFFKYILWHLNQSSFFSYLYFDLKHFS